MTPAARHAAAIGVLDRIGAGEAAEAALTRWGRGARYAGSGDRAAVRDIVYDVLRRWRSTAARGGAETGRARVLGLLREAGTDPGAIFTGAGHAPAPLTGAEAAGGRTPEGTEALDWPEWLLHRAEAAFGDATDAVLGGYRERAPIHLRVNAARTDREAVIAALSAEGIAVAPHPAVATALVVTGGARGLRGSAPVREGLVEVQDAHSQDLAAAVPLWPGARILDYCAGGGGKALALAAREPRARIAAHDAEAGRMADLPERARRAGAAIDLCAPGRTGGHWDVVLCDVPCSGSGSWRRDPEGKWRLTEARLEDLCRLQLDILHRAAGLRPGALVYATCSVFGDENEGTIGRFLAGAPGWRRCESRRWTPGPGGDGFFLCHLERTARSGDTP